MLLKRQLSNVPVLLSFPTLDALTAGETPPVATKGKNHSIVLPPQATPRLRLALRLLLVFAVPIPRHDFSGLSNDLGTVKPPR
jgi:hypothetical protein